MHVDTLLTKIIDEPESYSKTVLPKKDYGTLLSLYSSISSPTYITENQGRLILRILEENSKKLSKFSEEISHVISNPIWSRTFRQVEQVRKMYITPNPDDCATITIEFTFSSQIRKVLQDTSRLCENLDMTSNGKKYVADLTERNIITLVDALKPFKFEIDETLKNHYETIKSWSLQEVCDQFLIGNMTSTNFQKHITADLGIETAIDQNIIIDRSMRYQYRPEISKKIGENLTEVIANREKTRVWIDKKDHKISEIIASLISLKRTPILVVFDSLANEKYLENLEILSDALEENGIFDKIGVYFRLTNDEVGKKFNKIISEKHYNSVLDQSLQVAAVQSGKLPKFFLKNPWRPMSVIALDTKMGLRHGKTSVYANCCDCIVEWADQPTMFEKRIVNTWQ